MTNQRKGVLGSKLGMTQVWDESNRVVPVTVIKAGPCVVTAVRSPETDGYDAVQLGFGAIDTRKVNKPRSATLSSSAPMTPAATSSARLSARTSSRWVRRWT